MQSTATSTSSALDVRATTTDGVITVVIVHNGVQLAELTLPAPSKEPHALLSSLTLEGINVCLYQSAIDDHVVIDVLTETPGRPATPSNHGERRRGLRHLTWPWPTRAGQGSARACAGQGTHQLSPPLMFSTSRC
jgi:hypothetical protein